MNKGRITIHVCSRDRHSELSLLLQSLRTQTYQDWDIVILDDASGMPLNSCGFLMILINRIKLEGHGVKIIRNDKSFGVCYARNKIIEEDDFDNEFTCRIDDDVCCNPDYLERLLNVIKQGYDIASGVTPLMVQPELEREVKYVGTIINEHRLDNEGNLVMAKDECGFTYDKSIILPTHHFRSCALFKRKVTDSIKYEDNLTTVGFREEGFYSFRAILKGYKIGVDTGAIVYHFVTPSGGVRRQDYNECVMQDDLTYRKWIKRMCKKYGDFLSIYNKKVNKDA